LATGSLHIAPLNTAPSTSRGTREPYDWLTRLTRSRSKELLKVVAEIRVNLEALEGFAVQLEARVAQLSTAGNVPGVGNALPVGGSPAWEGQSLSDAYWFAAQDAERLLQQVRETLRYAAEASHATLTNYRTGDAQGRENNMRIAEAIVGGEQVPDGPSDGESA
jgi:hypothetical protein